MNSIWTVTELNDRVKNLLEEGFDVIWVGGEVSNLRRPASGHVYFSLKDEKSQVRAVFFRSPYGQRNAVRVPQARFDIEEGMQIVCRARLGVYAVRGEYQLVVESFEPRGVGALQKAFEQLKAKLQAEGLFDASRKKPIPFLPRKIGVITSPTGAVVRDVLTITRRRFSSIPILVAPVRVQGPEAPPEIILAIRNLQSAPDVDVIILARGGGSIEDLAPFNDEGVARAIAASRIPVVSAVGHETDFTIADFVSDLRAPTPSTAAELVLPLKQDLIAAVEALRLRMMRRQQRHFRDFLNRISVLTERLKDPKRRLTDLRMGVDDALERLQRALRAGSGLRRKSLQQQEGLLRHAGPLRDIRERRFVLEKLRKSMIAGTAGSLESMRNQFTTRMALLDSLNPLAVLSRGYALVRRLPEGRIIRDTRDVLRGDIVAVRVATGSFDARVVDVYRNQE